MLELIKNKMQIKCNNCEGELPKKGIFCPKCGTQTKCKSCDKFLEKEAIACIYCGEKVGNENSSNKNINSIEYKETRDDRTFKANFTDAIGENMSSAFANFLTNKFVPQPQIENTNEFEPIAEYSEIVDDTNIVSKKVKRKTNTTGTKLKKLFKKKSDVWTLVEPRLKATSSADYGKRLTLLLLALKEELDEELTRSELGKVLTAASVNTGSVRNYLSKNSDFNKVGQILNLTLPGSEKAKQILAEIYDESVENKWDVSKGKNNIKAKKAVSHKTVDLGLNDTERAKFREFAEQKKPRFQIDIILTVFYWLKENKGKDSLNMDDIHTGIQIIGEKTPKSLDVVLSKTKKEHKIDKLEKGYFKLNKIGRDYVKNQLPKVKKS